MTMAPAVGFSAPVTMLIVVVFVLSEFLRAYGEWRFVLMGLVLILVQRFAQNGLFPILEQWSRPRRIDRSTAKTASIKEERHAG